MRSQVRPKPDLTFSNGTIKDTVSQTITMDTHNVSQASANLLKLLKQVNQESKPCIITSHQGDAVLISKHDWESLQETLCLLSIPEMQESIIAGMTTPLSNCLCEEELEW